MFPLAHRRSPGPRGPVRGAREVALRALVRIEVDGAYANLALDQALSRWALPDPRDRALATELVYGVTRRRGTLDWALGQVASRPLADLTPWIRNILRQGAYQLLYLDRIPASAVIHEAVELAKRYGHPGVAGFVNAVLRGLQRRLPELPFPDPERDPAGYLEVAESAPRWLVERWLGEYGPEEARALLAAMNQPPPLTARVNRLRTDREALIQRLAAEGVTAQPTRYSPDGVVLTGVASAASLEALPSHREGLFTVQDESSMLVAPVVDPRPGETVLDIAAAPGGKSTHLAERMGDQGRVVAVDLHPHKIALIEAAAKRLGLRSVEPVCADGRTVGRLFAGRADRVLCDLPCSGLGTLARRPDARWRKRPEDIPTLAALQLELLRAAAQALRPGGVLVYSTCTITREENLAVVEAFLAEHPDFRPDDLTPFLPEALRGEPGVQEGWIQLLPHRHGTDGFFIARLVRRGH
ncbi:MAG: 16S rRNA (cytosine(967)-C(5))-methyltransferase RsmB [Bacillota bacterium]